MFCMLTPWDERTTPQTKVQGIMDNIKKRVAKAGIKNATVVSVQPPTIRGIGIAAGFAVQIEQGNSTDDIHAFEKNVQKFVAVAKKEYRDRRLHEKRLILEPSVNPPRFGDEVAYLRVRPALSDAQSHVYLSGIPKSVPSVS